MGFTQKDQLLLDWLAEQDPQGVNVRFEQNELILNCQDKYIAQQYWEERSLIKERLGLDVTIWACHRFFDSTCCLSKKKNVLFWQSEVWRKRLEFLNQNLLND